MLTAGRTIGERYLLLTRIAAGGMGEVWRANDQRLQRDVALKLLRPEHADDAAFRIRLRIEAQSAATVRSENVVDVYDWGEQVDESGRWLCYIAMELVEGETVAALIARDPVIDPERTSRIVTDTAAGLAAAHDRGLVHRDVKPANLLVTALGRIKIADFGIARAADASALTATGMVIGTAMYLSPEQVRGEPATAASDVYSLGVLAHQCLTGNAPFRGDGDIATATARLNAPVPPLPPSTPVALRDLVFAMLDRDPARRPTASQVADTAARAAVAAVPTTRLLPLPEAPTREFALATGTPVMVDAPPQVRSRWVTAAKPRRFALVGAAVMLLLAGIVGASLLLDDAPSGSSAATRPPHASATTSPRAAATKTVATPTPSGPAHHNPAVVRLAAVHVPPGHGPHGHGPDGHGPPGQQPGHGAKGPKGPKAPKPGDAKKPHGGP